MPQAHIFVPLSKDQAHRLVDAVMECEELALSASAYEDEDNGGWVFEANCAERPDIEHFNALARTVLGGELSFAVEEIEENFDWVGKSLEGLKPIRVGGFYIHGSHDAKTVPAGVIPIRIEAAQAFGTGHHETTAGCLEAIDRTLKKSTPRLMLDLGTGTGILAIAMAKRTRLPVLATDIDPLSVRTTVENAKLNDVDKQIVALEATGVDHRDIRNSAPFDLITANILAGPLTTLAPGISRIAAKGATIILSGLLERQAARVIAAYNMQDVILVHKLQRKDWTTLILQKR